MAGAGQAGWTLIPAGIEQDGSAPVLTLRCWFAAPDHPKAGVLLLPEVFGINPWVRSVAARLAEVGYAALAVPLFARTAPDLDLGYAEVDLIEGRRHKDLTSAANLLADLEQAASWLQSKLISPVEEEPLAPPGLGCVGFCFGGHVALLAATLPQVRATASFYGAGLPSSRPGGGPPTLDLLAGVQGRLWFFLGRQDPLISAADAEAIRAAVRCHDPQGQRLRVFEAEAGHGYMCNQRDAYVPEAAEQGWRLMLDLFDQGLNAS